MEENKKEKFVNSKLFFLIRLLLYGLFLFIIPGLFMFIRFGLFEKITSIQINGWTVVAILVVSFGFFKLIREVKNGMPFCYAVQVINGVLKVILPLVIMTLVVYFMQNSVKELLQVLYVTIPCEIAAILINPIPMWAYENKLGEEGYKMKTVLQSAGLFDFFKKEDKKQ